MREIYVLLPLLLPPPLPPVRWPTDGPPSANSIKFRTDFEKWNSPCSLINSGGTLLHSSVPFLPIPPPLALCLSGESKDQVTRRATCRLSVPPIHHGGLRERLSCVRWVKERPLVVVEQMRRRRRETREDVIIFGAEKLIYIR